LDPYTTFIPESEMDNFKFQTTGQYGGIGALIRRVGDFAVVSEPYEGFPADKAGLKAGDVLMEVSGKSVQSKDISDISELLKGVPGTDVEIVINRPGVEKPIKKKITREQITIPNVPFYGIIQDSIGYIRLTNFTTDAGKDVKESFLALKEKGAKGIILDLRNNPGGLLSEAVNVSNIFIPKDRLVVFTKGKVKESIKNYSTINNPADTIIPLVVLVNRGSASASEIVAGTMQDLDRGVIIGQRTFGKGLVQQTRPLSYNSQLKVTIAKYYIPSGRCIQALDYAHRNEDGSVGYVPDSLISEFKTKGGRKVYNGGGVQPDVKVEIEKLGDLAYNLYTKNLVFDFATEYYQKHTTIKKPGVFAIDDTTYSIFIKYLDGKEFDYKTKTEEGLNKLIEIAKKEKYYSMAENEIKQLQDKLAHDKHKDLQTFRKEISELMTDEIITRYYYQKGKIESSLIGDPMMESAIKTLKDQKDYSAILSGKKGDLAKKEKNPESEKLNDD
jgi:carboxyl-terminal processing protease